MSQNTTSHPDIKPTPSKSPTEKEREEARRAEAVERTRKNPSPSGNQAAREPSQLSLDRAADEGMIAPDPDDIDN